MCLIIKRTKHRDLKPRIAKKDIVVFKYLDIPCTFRDKPIKMCKKFFPPIIGKLFTYRLNKKYTTKLGVNGILVHEGFHAYISPLPPLEKALHHMDTVIAVGIIPAGSEYYIGTDSEIVGNNIIIQQVYKPKEFNHQFNFILTSIKTKLTI